MDRSLPVFAAVACLVVPERCCTNQEWALGCISRDYSVPVRDNRRKLAQFKKSVAREGDRCRLVFTKLFVNDDIYVWDTVNECAVRLNPRADGGDSGDVAGGDPTDDPRDDANGVPVRDPSGVPRNIPTGVIEVDGPELEDDPEDDTAVQEENLDDVVNHVSLGVMKKALQEQVLGVVLEDVLDQFSKVEKKLENNQELPCIQEEMA
ncbi:hypothetical protein HPB51_008900 [Rhipicephalus microplus]|uniref:Uncharacterized protein n=1 Tax=Rhipicephalus microplus TaxID=6941 RepID=A0A9J6ES24_RHIMP|nr:hypothetical protein HPB51_008900 [Rhipicephalus microplus]